MRCKRKGSETATRRRREREDGEERQIDRSVEVEVVCRQPPSSPPPTPPPHSSSGPSTQTRVPYRCLAVIIVYETVGSELRGLGVGFEANKGRMEGFLF